MIPVDQIEKQVMQKRMLSFKFIQYLYCFPESRSTSFCLLQPLKCHIGCLLIFRITADRFTEFFKRSRDIENIILNLKGKSQLCSASCIRATDTSSAPAKMAPIISDASISAPVFNR